MFARIGHLRLKTTLERAAFDQLTHQWQEAIRAQPGYRGSLTVTLHAHRQMTITLWETKRDADAWRMRPDLIRLLRDLHGMVEDHFVVEGSATAIDLFDSERTSAM